MERLKEQRCFGGVQGRYRHVSESCGPMEVGVYLPPGVSASSPAPMVVYLSGLTCTPDNVETKAGAQRVCAELGIIFVCPDTSPRGAGYDGEEEDWDFGTGAGFYVDATRQPWSGRYRMYTYVTQELPAFMARHFPTNGAKAIMGHSMGGHGALVIGLRAPEAWRSISAFSPIVAPSQVPWGHKAFGGYLGQDRAAWRAYDATELVASHQHPQPILIDQGLADGFLGEQLRPELFAQACEAVGQPLMLRQHTGYDHSYHFIATFIEDHLRHHGARLTRL